MPIPKHLGATLTNEQRAFLVRAVELTSFRAANSPPLSAVSIANELGWHRGLDYIELLVVGLAQLGLLWGLTGSRDALRFHLSNTLAPLQPVMSGPYLSTVAR